MNRYVLVTVCVLMAGRNAVALAQARDDGGAWRDAVREVHARFSGRPGTFAQFGDSITVTMAFWAPMAYEVRNAPPEMQQALTAVTAHIAPECWREWKGPEFGNDGMQTVAWALEHVHEWLERLNPEVALIMFGTNDMQNVDADTYEAQLGELVDRCLANGTIVILSTIPPRSGRVAEAAEFSERIRRVASDRQAPWIDFHAEVLARRPNDWDGSLPQFDEHEGYDVPTLIARDGVHPSHPAKYQNDYSEEALRCCGFSLRNYLAVMAYADVIEALHEATL